MHPSFSSPLFWPRCLRRLAASSLLAAVLGTLASSQAAETPVTIAIDPTHPGSAISPNYTGLSYEVAITLPNDEGVHYFRPDNRPLIELFHTLGIRSLRIGGNTSDRNVKRLPENADLDSLFAFAKAADVKVIYCLQLHDGDPAVAAATVKYVMDRYAPLVDSFSIGQEPSAYPKEKVDTRPATERMGPAAEKYPYSSYRREWERFAAAIIAAVPNVKFCGPSVHNNGEWARRFLEDFGQGHHVALVTEHLYPGGSANTLPSPQVGRDRMLSNDFVKVYDKLYHSFVPQAKAAGLPYRLEEVNSYFNGGAQNASNTFSASLWSLDFLYWWAAHDAAGLNFHSGDRVSMNNTYQPSRYAAFTSIPGGFSVMPVAYGLKAFDLGAHGRFLPAAITNDAGLNLTAYAVQAEDHSVSITLINKEHDATARDAVVTLALPASASNAKVVYLTAPNHDVAVHEGITLGGKPIESNGTWSGEWQPVSASSGSVQVHVPAASAAIVRVVLP